MLTITYRAPYCIDVHKEFTIGDTIHIAGLATRTVRNAIPEVKADAQELELLYEIFPSLPKCINNTVKFVGNDALFIVTNLEGLVFSTDS